MGPWGSSRAWATMSLRRVGLDGPRRRDHPQLGAGAGDHGGDDTGEEVGLHRPRLIEDGEVDGLAVDRLL